MTEFSKSLDNTLLQKYDVKLYGSDYHMYDIINDFLFCLLTNKIHYLFYQK